MNTAVADYLAARLDPHTVLVVLTPVPGDALTMLRQGLVWDASYNAGRLLGDVGAAMPDEALGGAPLLAWVACSSWHRCPLADAAVGAPLQCMLGRRSGAGVTRLPLIAPLRAACSCSPRCASR